MDESIGNVPTYQPVLNGLSSAPGQANYEEILGGMILRAGQAFSTDLG